MIDPDREGIIHQALFGKAKELGLSIRAIGNVADHIHTVLSIPPKLAIAECVRQLKGGSSHAVNLRSGGGFFRWQDGYGVLSLSEGSLPTVIRYVLAQKEHHVHGTMVATYERWTEEDEDVGT